MKDSAPWYFLLDQLISREGLSRSQIARRSGVSAKTVTSWLRGDVQSPRDWQPLAQVLRALQATTAETNLVLQGAGHPPVPRLARRVSPAELALLAGWLRLDVPFMPPDRPVETVVGRQKELVQAADNLRRQQRCVLVGMAGIGKTTLAIELAHQLRHEYEDGVFWGNLRTGVADAVLESWGQALGVDMTRMVDFDSRAAAMRTLFAHKKALIILDDVVDGRIALQMIPAHNPNCAVLVTTRSADAASLLTRRRAALALRLEPMHRPHSLTILATVLGQPDIDEAAADELAALLGDMPLALHISAALCADAGLTLHHLLALLRDLRYRLDYLRLEDRPLVRLAFEQSWALLDGAARRGLAALAVFAGRPFTTTAFAAAAGLTEPEAALLLTRLCRRSLLTMMKTAVPFTGAPQYQQHTLLAAFAAEKLPEDDPAWQRFCTHYAEWVSQPGWWRAAEQDLWGNVMAGMATAHQRQWWPLLLAYASHLTEAWRRQGLYSLARQGFAWALDAAGETADTAVAAQIRLAWGQACLEQSDYAEAQELLTAAQSYFESVSDLAGLAEVHYQLSRQQMAQDAYNDAENSIQQAWHAYQQIEDIKGMGRALFRLGNIFYHRGQYQRAVSLAADAIRSQKTVRDMLGLLRSHMLACSAYLQLGQIELAEEQCKTVAKLIEQVDDEAEHSIFYHVYADVLRKKQDFVAARQYAHKALKLSREMLDRNNEANTLLLLAGNEVNWNDAEPQRGLVDEGLGYCEEGLAICQAIGYELGRAFFMLMNGRLLAQNQQKQTACTIWLQGLELAQTLQHQWLQQRLQHLIDENCGLPSPLLVVPLAP